MHALREPVGAFVINLSMLDDENLSTEGRERLEAMLANVQRMVEALTELTAGLGLERGSSTPLAMLSRQSPPRKQSHPHGGPDHGSASASR